MSARTPADVLAEGIRSASASGFPVQRPTEEVAQMGLDALAAAGFHVHPLPPERVISCCDHNGNVVRAQEQTFTSPMGTGPLYRIPFDRPEPGVGDG